MYIECDAEKISNVFNILPILHIEWDCRKGQNWAIVIGWGRWVTGIAFTKECPHKHSSYNKDKGHYTCDKCGENI